MRRSDDGSVLMLVLVLMVVAGLIVIPLLGYAVAVFRSNSVVSQRTAAVEAAKGGVRMALGDPRDVFLTCDGGGDLTPTDPVISNIAVTVTCSEIAEVGPLEALGFEVPIGSVAMQLGAGVPSEFTGDRAQSGPVPPYPATPDWWSDPVQWSSTAANGTIWMPDLPRVPGTNRSSTAFDMPATFGCKVYFPGRYMDPLSLTGTVYFTSGVYYFEQPVTVWGDADVVVGYGLEELPNPDCSDDIQVAANVVGNPGTFDINGGGATWVFGDDARLLVDDSATTTSLRIRFNQRYADADRGGRVSIMTVNGDDVADIDHLVTNVNMVPRSKILNIVDNPDPTPDTWTTSAIAGTLYAPSSSTYTDKARLPLAPTGFTATPLRYDDAGVPRGAILLTWNEVAGQAAGGAFIDSYDLTINPIPPGPTICQPADLVVSALPDPPGGRQVSCSVKGLIVGQNYNVGVVAVNQVGASPSVGVAAQPMMSSAAIVVPDPPTNVAVVDSNVDDVAQISWDVPANGGAPITSYVATAHRVFLEPQADQLPVAGNVNLVMAPNQTVVTGVPAFDPNGDALSFLTVDSALLPAAVGAVTVAGLDVTITTTALALAGVYSLPYTVNDPYGQQGAGTITVVVSPTTSNAAPVAGAMSVAADVGVPNVNRVPVSDPNGDPLVLTVDTSGLDPLTWTVTSTGLDVAITTTAPDGTYVIPYTVRDPSGSVTGDSITVTVVRGDEEVGTCSVLATPDTPLANTCEIAGLADLVPGDATSGNVGYRFDVSAANMIGFSGPGSTPEPLVLGFNGSGVALTPPAPRIVEPWLPVPIIEIVASNGAVDASVAIAGYVAVPMGRIAVTNPDGDDISIKGGVSAGTFDVVDGRAVAGVAGSLPFGFKNDIVLQRKVRIVATARQITATAIVQVNEDGANYSVNSWVIQ